MPGLVGYISKDRSRINSTLISDMCNILKHREWYRTDSYTDEERGLAIAHIHLGIINNAPQPYLSQSGKVKIFMHGELYNDEAADCEQLEFVYHQYQKNDVDFAAKLNGSFVIIIIDEAKDRIIIANDRTASKPFFYFVDDTTIYFAPEMKALLLIPSLRKSLNQAAIANFLASGYFINGQTLIEGVRILDNASVIKVIGSGITTHKYCHFEFDETAEDRGFEYYQRTLSELIRRAVGRRIRTKHKYGVLLSGGYDSRGILGCYLDEKGNKDANTISWGYKEDIPQSDCAVSRKVASELGNIHRFYELRPQEVVNNLRDFIFLSDGLTDSFTSYPDSLKIFQKIREDQGIQIILRGDECFGWHSTAFDERSMFEILGISRLDKMQRYKNILKESYLESFIALNSQTMKAISSRCGAKNIHNRKDFFYRDQRLEYYLNFLNYVKTIEIEARNPWVDNDILDFMCTVPVRYRLDKYLYRKTIVRMFPKLFKEIAQKSNLIDWGYEFRNSQVLRDFVYRELIENRNIFDEFININGLKTELDRFFYSKNYGSRSSKLKRVIVWMLQRVPAAYVFAQKLIKPTSDIPMEMVIVRLLTLKIWCDLFMVPHKR